MELRRFQEELEEKILGEYAAKSSRTRGRRNKRKVESGKWRDLGDADCHSQRSRWLRNDRVQEVRGGDPSGAMRPGNDIYRDYRRSMV